MSSIEFNDILFASWNESLFSARTLGIILWVGLGALTVSLLILMRTRWGQVRPISKCVALSIFAHVLLVGYAYGTKLIFEVPPPLETDVVKLNFVDPDDGNQTERSAERQAQPWEKFVTDDDFQPDMSHPERQAPQFVALAARGSDAEVPTITAQPPIDTVAEIEPERPTATPPTGDPLSVTKSHVEAENIDNPTVAQRAEVDPLAPMAAELQRRFVENDNDEPIRDVSPQPDQLPGELLDVSEQVQRLADVAFNSHEPDAFTGPTDELKPSTSQSDSRQPSGDDGEDNGRPNQDSHADSTHNVDRWPASTPADALAKAAGRQSIIDTLGQLPAPRRRLGDGEQLPVIYSLRQSDRRLRAAEQLGGNAQTEAAVEAALKWLAEHQDSHGRWDARRHGAGVESNVLGHNRQGAGAQADTGITGLALLAFLGAGHSHLEGKYRENVQRGLEYLLRSQRDDGNLAGSARIYEAMYCHGMASLAISEAYALTGDHRLKASAERAVQYTIKAQDSSSGGWRYQPGDQGDMSQFGWQVMALKSAELAGIEVPQSTHAGMLRFLQSTSSGRHGGLASYRPGEAPSRTMTAEALACRSFLNLPRQGAMAREATSFIMEQLPSESRPNLYYWYYATLALFPEQSEDWQTWNAALQRQLISLQRRDGDFAGSWDTTTTWGGYGGRVYTTAVAALCLEVYYRYLPLYSQ